MIGRKASELLLWRWARRPRKESPFHSWSLISHKWLMDAGS